MVPVEVPEEDVVDGALHFNCLAYLCDYFGVGVRGGEPYGAVEKDAEVANLVAPVADAEPGDADLLGHPGLGCFARGS